MLMSASSLHFPRTAQRRGSRGFCRLLNSVDLYAPAGLQFAGHIVTPGGSFHIDDLPRPAVILENADIERVAAARSRYSWETLWIIWHFDFEHREWHEISRCTSSDTSWSVDLAPVAHRLLHPPGSALAEDRARPVTEQLAAMIDGVLRDVSREESCYVLAGIERHIACEMVRRIDNLSVIRPKVLRPRTSAA